LSNDLTLPPLAILAGGFGTRMRPFTEKVPKSLLLVAGEPFIAHQLRFFRQEGVERIVLCVGHLGDQIVAFVGDGGPFGVRVSYSFDGEPNLGTGGAIRKALPLLGGEFLLSYGDSFLDTPIAPVVGKFRRGGLLAMMTVLHNAGRWGTSNVEFIDGRVIGYSKEPTPQMSYIDYGLSLLKAEVFDHTPEGNAFDLGFVYRRLVQRGVMSGYEVTKRFYEIGSPAGLAETDAHLRQRTANPTTNGTGVLN